MASHGSPVAWATLAMLGTARDNRLSVETVLYRYRAGGSAGALRRLSCGAAHPLFALGPFWGVWKRMFELLKPKRLTTNRHPLMRPPCGRISTVRGLKKDQAIGRKPWRVE